MTTSIDDLESGPGTEMEFSDGMVQSVTSDSGHKILGLVGLLNGLNEDFDWEKERREAWGE
jgi:hypothetical protein